jgi:5-methylcytosine-specific restriction endonuclease McrA
MKTKNRDELRTGLTPHRIRQLRGKVAFLQEFKCWGCKEPLIPSNGYSHLHHKNGDPKDHHISNLAVCCQLCHHDSHGWRDSAQRGLHPRKKKLSKKELVNNRIQPLGEKGEW